jgi:pectate lyase
MRCFFVLVLSCCIGEGYAQERPLAFPGAEGFGKYTTGGRGGKVLVVSNLNDDGEGSLRKAIRSKQTRTIIFSVSGTIELKSPLDINYGDLTIAGQSAPGDGICLRDYTVNINADNVIIRFLRFRLGDETGQEGDAFSGNKAKSDIIIDHCSMSWATDECASFYRNKNFTLQWCIMSESLNNSVHTKGEHGYGGIWGGENATFHHNLIASHNSRLPRFSGSSTTPNGPNELVDFRNNVIYNWMHNNSYGGEKGKYNIVNNYYKPGPATDKSRNGKFLNPSSPYGKFFVEGNIIHDQPSIFKNNKSGVLANRLDSVFASNPFEVGTIVTHSAEKACELVLKNAGASFKRDEVDARIISETRKGESRSGKNRNGIIDSQKDVGGWPTLKSNPVEADTDGDGMPDAFEKRNSLDPTHGEDAAAMAVNSAYTNLEIYLNDLVKEVMNLN